MRCPEFRRARLYGRSSGDRWSLYAIGVSAALLLPLLVLDLGLVTQLVLGTAGASVPRDWLLGTWISGSILPWPLLGNDRSCLLLLIAFGVLVGTLEVVSLWLLHRAVDRAALAVVMRFHADVQRHAFRLGTTDLLGGRRTAPEQLLGETTDELYRGLLRWWSAVPYAVVAVSALVALALVVNVWLTLVVLLSVLLVRLVYGGIYRRTRERAEPWTQEAARQREHLMAHIRLAPLATGYGVADAPGARFPEMLGRYRAAQLRARDCWAGLGPTLLMLIVWALTYIGLVVGLSRYVTVAGTVTLTAALIGAYYPAARLYRLRASLASAETAAMRLFAYLRREPAVKEMSHARPMGPVVESIRLDQVTLANAEGRKLLDRVDLTLAAGRRFALLATDPPAATALAGLLIRLYDPAAGRVVFDGRDIAQATLATLRRQSVLVPADGILFEGTVHDNITCGDASFTMLQVTDAAKQARANNFVLELPRGFSTMIGPEGVQVDVGQAFRIALARALLRNPSVLIVEEPRSEMDDATEILLMEALRLAAQDRTLIVIPNRLESLQQSHQIVLMHEGHIVAQGPHAELLESCELYRHLNYVRFHQYRHVR